jgi:F-type H+-transporting ATPase subunit delta
MAYDPIARRYAQAAFEAAKAEGLTGETREHLCALAGAASRDAEVAKWLANPDVTADEKLGALERAVQGQWPWVVKALLATMLTMGRPEYVEQIAEAFIALDDRDQGRLRVLVRSARVVSQASLTRLQRILERWQGKHVTLETEVSPALIGGLEIHMEHRVLNGSVRSELDALRERLSSVRVS